LPSFREHHRITEDFLGWDIPEVHRTIDAAAAYLGGRHRVVGHNLKMARAVEDLFGRDGLIVFTCHLLEDAGVLVPARRATKRRPKTSAPVRTTAPGRRAGRTAPKSAGQLDLML
jgi:hypothetical protein